MSSDRFHKGERKKSRNDVVEIRTRDQKTTDLEASDSTNNVARSIVLISYSSRSSRREPGPTTRWGDGGTRARTAAGPIFSLLVGVVVGLFCLSFERSLRRDRSAFDGGFHGRTATYFHRTKVTYLITLCSYLTSVCLDDTTGTKEGRCPIRTSRHGSPDKRMGHTGSTHARLARRTDARTAPAHAQTKESRRG
eukprot:4071880-Prymnesium_polylepis.1